MATLTGSDRRYLRGLANPRKAVVQVGEGGFTPGIARAADDALRAHELVKIRIVADREQRRAIADQIAAETRSEIAGMIGRVAIFYREAGDPDDRSIRLPSANR